MARFEGDTTGIVQRLRAVAEVDEAACSVRLNAVAEVLWRALPVERRRVADFLDQPAEAFTPSPEQLHHMLDLALGLQAGASTPQELSVWRLLGEIILQQGFGGLRDASLWNARISPGDISHDAQRRHLLALLRGTPHLIPESLCRTLQGALGSLQQGLAPVALFQPASATDREQTKSGAQFRIVALIETFANPPELRNRLIEAAANSAGVSEETVRGWITKVRKDDGGPQAMAIFAAIAKPKADDPPPLRRREELPPTFLKRLDEAVAVWKAAGGSSRSAAP